MNSAQREKFEAKFGHLVSVLPVGYQGAMEGYLAGQSDRDEEVRGLVEALNLCRRSHDTCEDSWYSCPKSVDGCANDGAGTECNCGADYINAIIDAALAAYTDTTTTEKGK